MIKKIIKIFSIILILGFIYFVNSDYSAVKVTVYKTRTTKSLLKKQIPNILLYTGLNYLYSININNSKSVVISGFLGKGKAADSVIEFKKNEYAISNESNAINICIPSHCSYNNFASTINGYYENNQFYNFEGVGDLAFYNGYLYATDVLRGVIVKININTFKAQEVVSNLLNPHGIYFYNNNLYINLENYNNCSLIKLSVNNFNNISCVVNLGSYADGVSGYNNTLFIVRDTLSSSGLYSANVYKINLKSNTSSLYLSINKQYIDGIAFNSKNVYAVFRSANPDVFGTKYYTYSEGVYNITGGNVKLLVKGIFDGVNFL